MCIDISHPEPTAVTWDFDRSNVLTTASYGAYKEIVFAKAGTFEITLTAQLGVCTSHQTKTIIVYESQEASQPGGRLGHSETGIKEYKIYPNPNDGKFRAWFSLYKVTDMAGFNGNVINEQAGAGSNEYAFNFDITGHSAGVYWLIAEVDNKIKTFRLVIY